VESEAGRDVRRELARAVVSNGWGLLELRPVRMSLEEVFLSLTTDEARPNLEPGTPNVEPGTRNVEPAEPVAEVEHE
jgi:ABC-2 type transport system ATP-binding protein